MKYTRFRQAGFTLIEVLVASAIGIASIGLLLSLFAGSLDRMSRVETQSQRLIVEKEIVGRLSLINPAATRTGKGSLGKWTYHWSSQPLTEFRKTTDYFSSDSTPRKVALFMINIRLGAANGKTVDIEIQRLGWRT